MRDDADKTLYKLIVEVHNDYFCMIYRFTQ